MSDELQEQKGYAERMRASDTNKFSMSKEEKSRRKKLWDRVISRSVTAMDRESVSNPSKGGNVTGVNKPSTGEQVKTGFTAFKKLFNL